MSSAQSTQQLICHPETPCEVLAGVEVRVLLDGGGLMLHYTLSGAMAKLKVPEPANPGPADDLWRHTCCEAFVAPAGEGYREFNFSPSGQWAIYQFSAYRQRVEAAPPGKGLDISLARRAGKLDLSVEIPAMLVPVGPFRLGLSAVVEGTGGRISYWALAHTPGKPDFHRHDTFTLRFDPP